MPRRTRLRLLAVGVAILLALGFLIVFSTGRAPPGTPLPKPNGYDDFLRAAALVTGDPAFQPLDPVALRTLVRSNSEPLRLVRLGLSRQCAFPADSAMTNISAMMSELADLKQLARLLVAEGHSCEIEDRFADAAHSYVDAIRFGNEISRGGFIINRLVGVACEAIGQIPLSAIAPKLKPEEARKVIEDLERIDRTGVTWDETMRSEQRFSQYQLRQGFHPVAWAATRLEVWRSRQRAAARHKRIVAHVRLTTTELALRCYQSEAGHVPTALEQLVPKYLQRVPLDPFSGRPMLYRPRGTNWLVYSVGPDGVDDGGKPVGRSAVGTVPKGDLFYDSPY